MQLVVLVILIASLMSASALEFKATNTATGTPGGARFDRDYGLRHSKEVLGKASSFIWKTFKQSPSNRKSVALIQLIVDGYNGVSYTLNNDIHISAGYVAGYQGNLRAEITGVLYHESTHLWQWNGNGKAPSGLIDGIADFVRLKAGYAPSHWVKPGHGSRWDQGHDVTARFLDYCNNKHMKGGSFVAKVNQKMRDGYSDQMFVELTGKTVDALWSDYKAAYVLNKCIA